MVKINLTRLAALVIACFFSIATIDAQTKVWGVGSSTGVAEAEFQNNFVQAGSFTAGDNPTAWTALSVNESDGSVTPGAAYWTRNLTGFSQGAYWSGTTPVSSPSQANGVAIFDSDFLDNAGVANAFGTGTSPSDHRGELISPRIDLSGYTDSALIVQCYALYRELRGGDEISVSVSVDDGQTWAATESVKTAIPDLTQGFARMLFSNVTAGVANLSQCRIRFTFDGGYYFAIIDDVTIEVAPTYDISMGGAEPGSNLLIGSGDHVKIGGNRYIPLHNIIHANDVREWFWGGKATNYGAVDILPQDSAAIYVQIDFVDAITGSTTPAVYLDTMYYDSLAAGDVSGETQIEYFDDLSFIINNGVGQYNVTYWVAHKNDDGNASNDTARHAFTITDNSGPLTNYISKVRLSTTDGAVRATSSSFPGGGPFSAWEFGSVFYFPRGASDSVSIDSVAFRYRLTNGFSGSATQTLFCNIYQMDASASATLNDGALLTQVGVSPIALTGLGTASGTASGDYGLAIANSFVDASSGGAMAPLVDNGFYYVSILTSPSLTGGAATFDSDDVPWYGSEDVRNYYMNAAMTRRDSVINPSPLSVTDNAGTANWYWTGFSSGSTPSLGLFLGIKPVALSVSTVWAEQGATLNVYPNPVQDVLNIDLTLEDADDVMYIVTDVSGRVLNITESQNVTSDKQSLDVSGLPAGVYMITAKTSNGKSSTERFIVK